MPAIELPEACGVMLLPDCTLFPHGGLPLHIFEPRYRRMLSDSLEGHCFFAVTRLLSAETKFPGACAAQVGTIGLVRVSREREDGTSNLLLHGVLRVRFVEWLVQHPYPFARIEPMASLFEPKGQEAAAMRTLRGAVEDASQGLEPTAREQLFALLDRADDPGLMTDIVSQQFIHDPDLRQELLENPAIGERIPKICAALRRMAG